MITVKDEKMCIDKQDLKALLLASYGSERSAVLYIAMFRILVIVMAVFMVLHDSVFSGVFISMIQVFGFISDYRKLEDIDMKENIIRMTEIAD